MTRWLGGLLLAGAAFPGPVQASDLIVGACYLEINVTFRSSLQAVPGQVGADVDGDGTCLLVLPTGTFEATVDGDFDRPSPMAPNFGCGGGLGTGNLNLTVVGVGTFSGALLVVATPVAAVVLVASEGTTPPEFVAAGAFVHVPGLPDALCAVDGLGATTWKGVLVFEDPTVV